MVMNKSSLFSKSLDCSLSLPAQCELWQSPEESDCTIPEDSIIKMIILYHNVAHTTYLSSPCRRCVRES